MRAMRAWSITGRDGTAYEAHGALRLGLPAASSTYWALPCVPIGPGFAIDTVLYAALAWLLMRGPPALRRVHLRRRGRCPWCAYPVGVSPVCAECGAPSSA